MAKLKWVLTAAFVACSSASFAGGINTNTNMSAAFDRTLSRDAVIAIDGVYFNPAGVAFLKPGLHLSFNWQMIYQTRTIDNHYPLYANNTANPTPDRRFKGHAFAPFFPSFHAAYNWKKWSFQASAGVGGGGGKCIFDDGLGSFEKLVSETAIAASGLAQTVDASLASNLLAAGVPAQTVQALAGQGFSSDQYFGKKGSYSATSFMRGRQYYFGLSLGAAYKIRDDLSVYAGIRGVYASCNYYGYVRNIKVGNMPLYQVLDPSKENSADIELNSDQSGFGVTPFLGIDYKVGRWNFAAKYEFKTRMRLKNEAVNQFPSIGNLAGNLGAALAGNLQQLGLPQAQAQGIAEATLSTPAVTSAMTSLKAGFDAGIEEATGEYQDGRKIAADLPAILTLGAAYTPIDQLRLNAGFHYYFDKQATAYNHRNEKLRRGTIEYSFGAEYDVTKRVTASAGFQSTNYGLSNDYMDDKSFVVSSCSVGCGAAVKLTKRMTLNVAYFHSFYGRKRTSHDVQLSPETTFTYQADFTRNNNVVGAGIDIDL